MARYKVTKQQLERVVESFVTNNTKKPVKGSVSESRDRLTKQNLLSESWWNEIVTVGGESVTNGTAIAILSSLAAGVTVLAGDFKTKIKNLFKNNTDEVKEGVKTMNRVSKTMFGKSIKELSDDEVMKLAKVYKVDDELIKASRGSN